MTVNDALLVAAAVASILYALLVILAIVIWNHDCRCDEHCGRRHDSDARP